MLVGRQEDKAAIRALLAECEWSARVLELVGEPGIGKTALLAWAAEQAGASGALTLTAKATNADGGAVPFAALVEALDDHVAERHDWRETMSGDGLAALAEIFPGLAEFRGPRVERHQIHRAVRELLERLGGRRGIVLALDDVHWADSALTELLAYLMRRPPRARLLLVLAYRPRQVDPRLAAAIATGPAAVHRVELTPLTEQQSQELLGSDRSSQAAALHRASGGNPFYLQALAVSDLPAGARPRSVLLAELAGLSAPAHRAAQAAAVIGDPFDAELVAEVAGLDQSEVTHALDELHRHDLVRSHGLSRFAYRHDLVRQLIYDSTGACWRRDAHARAGNALLRRGEPLPACATHIARSAIAGDREAISVLRAAADELRWQAPGVAATMVREAIRLLPTEDLGTADHCDLQLLLARCLTADGRPYDARDVIHQLLHQLPSRHERRPSAVTVAAMIERILGYHTRARALLRRELGTVKDPATAAGLELELGMVGMLAGDFTADRALIDNAYQTACQLDNLALQAHAAALIALADYASGSIKAAQARADTAAALLDATPDHTLVTNLETTVYLGWSEMFLERFHLALGHLQRGLRLARRTGQDYLLPYLLGGIACVYQWLGQLDTAARWADDAVSTAELTGSDELRTMTYTLHALIAIHQGDIELAHQSAQRAVAAAGSDRDWWSATAAVMHGEARLLLGGDPEECLHTIVDAVGGPNLDAIDPGSKPHWYQTFIYAEIANGNLPAAQTWLDRMTAAANQLDGTLPCRSALVRLAHGHLLLASGTPVPAIEEALAAAAVFAKSANELDHARARLLAGQALAASGQRNQAIAELTAARAAFATSGAHRLHDEATHALRRLGHRVSRRPPANKTLQQLTRRETQIADLIAKGLSNAQIADHLVLSVRTVDAHLRNIFTKLAVTSRAAVAAYATSRHVA